jgi:hypothetical protein
MSAPSSSNRRERRRAQPTLSRTLTNDAKVAASITEVGDDVVVALNGHRTWVLGWPRGSDLGIGRATEAVVSVIGPAGLAELLDERRYGQEGDS